MAAKLTPRQILQLAFLETLPPKLERMKRVIELLSTNHADEVQVLDIYAASEQPIEGQVRGLQRLLDELKAQAAQANLTALAENFGYMGGLLRRVGGHHLKVRGLAELLAGARINFEGAYREASTPIVTPDVEEDEVSS